MEGANQRIIADLKVAILSWLENEGDARSTLAGALVVLDLLRRHAPLTNEVVFSSGGQISGGRGAALKNTLEEYGISRSYLADGVTTRSTSKFERLLIALDYGNRLAPLPDEQRRDAVNQLVEPILEAINRQLRAETLTVACDIRLSPVAWIKTILDAAHDRSGGRVEQHLVGAKLEKRFPDQNIASHAAFAADRQTQRPGDFQVGDTVYHVTANPMPPVIEKSAANLASGLRPILIVPRQRVEAARIFAADQSIEDYLAIFPMEDFLAQNIIEMADASQEQHLDALKEVIEIYNRRVQQSETDLSLRIRIR